MPYKDRENRRRHDREKYANDPSFRNRERRRLSKYREENPEKVSVWFKLNVNRTNATKEAWAKANPEKVKESSRKWYKLHKELAKERGRNYSKKNPHVAKTVKARRRTRLTKAGGSFTVFEWKDLCKKYGNRCLCCGKRRKLTADHVIPVSKGGTSNIENIQPLCKSCNSMKS